MQQCSHQYICFKVFYYYNLIYTNEYVLILFQGFIISLYIHLREWTWQN